MPEAIKMLFALIYYFFFAV